MYGAFAGKAAVAHTNRVAHLIRLAAHRLMRVHRAQGSQFHIYKKRDVHAWLRSAASAPLSWRRRHWIVVGLLLALTASVGLFPPRGANATHDSATDELTTLDLELPPLPQQVGSATAI